MNYGLSQIVNVAVLVMAAISMNGCKTAASSTTQDVRVEEKVPGNGETSTRYTLYWLADGGKQVCRGRCSDSADFLNAGADKEGPSQRRACRENLEVAAADASEWKEEPLKTMYELLSRPDLQELPAANAQRYLARLNPLFARAGNTPENDFVDPITKDTPNARLCKSSKSAQGALLRETVAKCTRDAAFEAGQVKLKAYMSYAWPQEDHSYEKDKNYILYFRGSSVKTGLDTAAGAVVNKDSCSVEVLLLTSADIMTAFPSSRVAGVANSQGSESKPRAVQPATLTRQQAAGASPTTTAAFKPQPEKAKQCIEAGNRCEFYGTPCCVGARCQYKHFASDILLCK